MSIALPTRNHQTVVFVRTSASDSNRYRERATRFVNSLNRSGDGPTSTIKADIVSVDDKGRMASGLTWDIPSYYPSHVTGSPALRQAASEAGYAQSLILAPCDSEIADYSDPDVYVDDDVADDDPYGDEPYTPFRTVAADDPSVNVSNEINVPMDLPAAGAVVYVVHFNA